MDLEATPATLAAREPWEEPQIILERSLEVQAQNGYPPQSPWDNSPFGSIGPLGTSGGRGACL